MNLEEERLQWKHDAQNIKRYVDNLITVLVDDANADPAAYMAVDMVYRPYVQWLHSAQLEGIDAPLIRNSGVYLISTMIIEMCRRMNRVDGDMEQALKWVDDFMQTLDGEIDQDLTELARRNNVNRKTNPRNDPK